MISLSTGLRPSLLILQFVRSTNPLPPRTDTGSHVVESLGQMSDYPCQPLSAIYNNLFSKQNGGYPKPSNSIMSLMYDE